MGCFLACFGFTKRRRRKGSFKIVSGDQSYGSYVPLDSDAIVKLDNDEMQKASATKLRDKPKESSTGKVKKKVSFNLNVKSYEPLPNEEISTYLSEGEEKTMWEYNQEETAGASMKYLNSEENWMASKFGSFSSSYRYQNIRNSSDEEDEIQLEESDLDDDNDNDELDFDEDDVCESYDFDNKKISQVEFSNPNAASMEAEENASTDQLARERNSNLVQLQALPNQEENKTESNQNARNRSQYALSVLNPVANLTEWKEVKAKARQQLKHQKENIMLEHQQHISSRRKNSDPLALNSSPHSNHFKHQYHEVAVDASLSNWLASSKTQSNAKDRIAAIGEHHEKKTRWMHQTHSVDNIDQF